MASITKVPRSKYYYALWRNAEGKLIWRSTRTTDRKLAKVMAEDFERAERLGQAEELTASAARDILDGILKRVSPETIEVASIREHFQNWLESKKAEGTKESTIKRYSGALDSLSSFLANKADRPLTVLVANDIEKWRNKLVDEGRSATTANWSVRIIGTALETAFRRGEIRMNPARAIAPVVKNDADERLPFSMDQVKALLSKASDDWRGAILFGYHAGMRLTDAAGLTWRNIDLIERTVAFEEKKTARRKKASQKVTKLYLHADLSSYLEQRSVTDDPEQPLFPSLVGRSAGSAGGLSNEFKRLMESANIRIPLGRDKKGKGRQLSLLSFHSLRHSFVSRLVEGQVHDELRRRLAGHSTDEAHKRYIHMDVSAQKSAIDNLESVL